MDNEVTLPDGTTHREFILGDLRRRWGKVHRVPIGKNRKVGEILRWCREQPGEWYHSIGGEVFYFENPKVAVFFKLRWASLNEGEE